MPDFLTMAESSARRKKFLGVVNTRHFCIGRSNGEDPQILHMQRQGCSTVDYRVGYTWTFLTEKPVLSVDSIMERRFSLFSGPFLVYLWPHIKIGLTDQHAIAPENIVAR